MKHIGRDDKLYEIVNLFDTVGRTHGYKLGDVDSEKVFIENIVKSLSRNRKDPTLLHGRRIELMFGFVAAALGNCSIVKREDIGELYASDSDIKRPDYHIILNNGDQFLVEVKNRYKGGPFRQYRFKHLYLQSLEKYAKLLNLNLKIALYWPKVNTWTLVSADKLPRTSKGATINFIDALKMNEMSLLGDRLLATVPPLILRIITDSSKPRRVNDFGQVDFTIGGIEFCCGDVKIENNFEKNLAFYLILYGSWLASEPKAKVEAKELLSINFEITSPETTPKQGFETIGYLSGMISNQYNDLTAPDRKIERLSPDIEPGSLGLFIPHDYKGKYLPLWRFSVRPNYDIGGTTQPNVENMPNIHSS